jgi:diguanylate cyclase (GGDEF)-like protein/PAS domain S-box-containing protein
MHNLPMPPFSFRRVSGHADDRLHERDSAQRNNERRPALAAMGERYRQMVALSPEALLICRAGKLVLANPAAARLLGVADPQQLNDRAVSEFIDPRFHALFNECAAAPCAPGFHEQVWRRADGSRFDAEIGLSDLLFDDNPALQIVLRDISTRKRAEALQLGQNHILNLIATGAALSEVLREIACFIEQHSDRGLCSILLLDEAEETLVERIAPSLPAAYLERICVARIGPHSCSCGTAVFHSEPVMVTDIASDPLWESRHALALEYGLRACTSWSIFGRDKKVLGSFALYFREPVAPAAADLELFNMCTKLAGIAIERRAAEERIRTLAHYDGLTGLPNRFLFTEYLDVALRNAQRRRKQFAVLFLDLDRFKEVNDTLGHDAGDQALREIAARLRACVRDSDKVARMGGDEFYVLIEDLDDGRHAAEVGRKLLEAAARPVRIGDRSCLLGASIGVALYPRDGADGRSLLMNADSAMYEAKAAGRNACRFHSQDVLPRECELARHK